jgi:hypothetical protein
MWRRGMGAVWVGAGIRLFRVVPCSGFIRCGAVPLAAFIPSRVPGRGRGAWGGSASESGQAGPIRLAPCRPGRRAE